jgi:phage I-like protein
MNPLILNRQGTLPTDGWYEIETAGQHFNATAGVVQALDAEAFASIVNRFATAAAKPNFAGLLIDQDHFSLDPEKSSEAFGWLKEVRNREGHLEGRIEWTDIGQPAVEKGRFKFFSTVYEAADVVKIGTKKIKNRDYPVVRPLALDRLALTNDPNNKGGKPISNRAGKSASEEENQNHTMLTKLIPLLALAADATEDVALAQVQALKNRAATADALKAERDTLLAAQVETDLEKYKNRFKPENREKIKAALIANRATTVELLEATEAPAVVVEETAEQKRLTNRGTAKQPTEAETKALAESAKATRIANRAHVIQKDKSAKGALYPFQNAFRDAEAEEAGK